MPRARTAIATATRNRSRRVRPARRRRPTTTTAAPDPAAAEQPPAPPNQPPTTPHHHQQHHHHRRQPPTKNHHHHHQQHRRPPTATTTSSATPPAPPAPPAPAACFNDAAETPALCSSLCSNPAGALAALRDPCASLGSSAPCDAFPNPPGKPCDANRSTCSNAIPSAAIAITPPAKLDRDSRNSIVCIAFPEPPNSAADPGNPDATHAPDGSRRNSARNSGSANNRSINRPARSSWVSLDDTVHLAGAVSGRAAKAGLRARSGSGGQHRRRTG